MGLVRRRWRTCLGNPVPSSWGLLPLAIISSASNCCTCSSRPLCCLETYQMLDQVLASYLHFFPFFFAEISKYARVCLCRECYCSPAVAGSPTHTWHCGPCQCERAEAETGAQREEVMQKYTTRLVLQLMKCHVCVVLITSPTSQTWQLLLTWSRLSIIRRSWPLDGAEEGHPAHQSLWYEVLRVIICTAGGLELKCHKVTAGFITCFRCEWMRGRD